MTIRLRLALIFSAATLALLIGGGVLFVTRLESGLEDSLTATAGNRADAVIALTAADPSTSISTAVGRRELFASRSGGFVQLLTDGGSIRGSSRSIEHRPLLTSAQAHSASRRTVVFDNTVQVTVSADAGPEPMRILARRIGRSNEIVAVAISRDVVDQAVSRARLELTGLDVAVLLLAGPGSWLLTRAALRPVERMRLEVGDLDARNVRAGVNVPDSHDEIARLGHTFNGLLGRLHDALSREQALVADAGHELRTPLTVLKGELELARRPGRSREQLAGTIEVAADETDRLVRLTEDLLFLSVEDGDARGLDAQTFEVTEVVRSAARAVSARVAAGGLDIVVVAVDSVTATGNAEWIRQAVVNLLVNAARYARPGTTVTVTVAQGRSTTQVCVADDGPGFPPEFLPIAFDRFTRADGSRARASDNDHGPGGNGLGLAIVKSILARHGGTATASNRPQGGAQVLLSWSTSSQDPVS